MIKMRSLVIAILLLICVACKTTTKTIEVPVETIKTEYITQQTFDSVFIHDSIDKYVSGDTLIMYKYKYIYKYLNRVDTLVKIDSIPYTVTVESVTVKEVNHIKGYQYILMCLGSIFILLVAYRIYKYINSKITTKSK
jgi:hypothetical protein